MLPALNRRRCGDGYPQESMTNTDSTWGGFAPETMIRDVKAAARKAEHAEVERLLDECAGQVGKGGIYAEVLSWAARAYLSKGHLSDAALRAAEAYELGARIYKDGAACSLDDAERTALDIALGAAIEVQAQLAESRNGNVEAVRYLEAMLDVHAGSDFVTRIRKNLLRLTLPGQAALPLNWVPLAGFDGEENPIGRRPVLLFFWAHWCSDSRTQGRALNRLFDAGAHSDLALVAATRLFGYISKGTAAPEADEREQISAVLDAEYSWMRNRPGTSVLLNAANCARYGASTFPTLVVLDAAGIVRGYHPGVMKFEALVEFARA